MGVTATQGSTDCPAWCPRQTVTGTEGHKGVLRRGETAPREGEGYSAEKEKLGQPNFGLTLEQ